MNDAFKQADFCSTTPRANTIEFVYANQEVGGGSLNWQVNYTSTVP
jgi:hypothetical protein